MFGNSSINIFFRVYSMVNAHYFMDRSYLCLLEPAWSFKFTSLKYNSCVYKFRFVL